MRAHPPGSVRLLSQARMPLGQGYPSWHQPVRAERTVPRRQALRIGAGGSLLEKTPDRLASGKEPGRLFAGPPWCGREVGPTGGPLEPSTGFSSRLQRLPPRRLLASVLLDVPPRPSPRLSNRGGPPAIGPGLASLLPRFSAAWPGLKRRPPPRALAPSRLALSRPSRRYQEIMRSSASTMLAWISKAMLCAALLASAEGHALAYEKLATARLAPTPEMHMPAHLQPTTDSALGTPKESRHSAELAKATTSASASATVDVVQERVPTGPPEIASNTQPTTNAFACLDAASDVVHVTGFHDTKYITRNAKDRAFDARSATFLIENETHGIITSQGNADQTGMCWAGGYAYSTKPWDASWDHHKDLDGPTRNSSVINNASYAMTITSMHFFNVHDGPRSNNGVNWTVQHVWGEYVRDDCIENDHFASGRVYDSLFDGCYTGVSTRPSSASDGTGKVLTLEKVLLRLHPMPYPYKWQKKGGSIDDNGKPYSGSGIPYGHGKFFKYEERGLERNNHFVLADSVFAAGFGHVGGRKFNLPHPDLIDQCQGVVFAWLGDDRFPGGDTIAAVQRKFPACITVLEGQEARDFWRQKVIDWHQRHPDVGTHRKPAKPGEVIFPLKF